MSERDTISITEIIKQLSELLKETQYPARDVYAYIDKAAEIERSDRALKRAAHQAEDMFEAVVAAACAAGKLLDELKEVKVW